MHFSDIEAITKQIKHDVAADVSDWLGDWARDFNRRQPRSGFITMKMGHKPRHRPRPVCDPRGTCCAIFPAMSARAPTLFMPSRFTVPIAARPISRCISVVKSRWYTSNSRSPLSKTARTGLNLPFGSWVTPMKMSLTAFETTLKTVYRHLVRRDMPEHVAELCGKKAIGNAFQNVGHGRKKYAPLGIDPFVVLSEEALAHIALNIEKRHVIGHNLGIADEHYVALTQTDQPGETVSLIAEDIGRFADSCLGRDRRTGKRAPAERRDVT